MAPKFAFTSYSQYFIVCLWHLLLVQSYITMVRQLPQPRHYLETSLVVVSSEKRQFDFKQLIEKCSENAVYTTAVRAAAQYLHSSETLTQSGVNSVIKIYGLAALVDDAVDALSIAESKGVSLNVRHYNAVINVCRKHKRYDDALAVYERLLEASSSKPSNNGLFLSPDIASKSSIIGVLGEQGHWERALKIFKEVKVEEKDNILFTTMLCTLEKCSRISESLEVFEEMMNMSYSQKRSYDDSINVSVDSSPVIGSSKERKPDKATIAPTIQMYTSVISSLGKNGDWERSWALFQNMQKEEGGLLALIPDKVLVFTMVRILEKAGQLEKAALVKQSSLKHFQLPSASEENNPSAPNFNDLIREGKRSGDFRAAEAAADSWLLLDSSVLSPSGVTACINVYGLSAQPKKALSLLQRMQERGVGVNVVQYNAVMAACVKGNKFDEALHLFSLMEDGPSDDTTQPLDLREAVSSSPSTTTPTPLEPLAPAPLSLFPPLVRDTYSYGTALNALGKKGSWVESLALLRHLEKKTGRGVQRTTIMCNTVLSALGKAKQCDTAVRLYTDMTLNGPYPDRVTNLTMISVYERADRFDAGAVVRNYLGMSPALVRRVESPTVSGAGAVATGEGNVTVSGPAGAKGRESKGRKEVSTGTSSKSRTPLKPLRKTAKLDKTGSSQVSVKITERTSKDEEYFPAGIRLSPAGTLKDKLMESGRRRVGQATSDKMTRIGADGGIEEFVEPSRAGDAVSGTATAGSVMTLPSAAGTADDSSGEIEEMEGGRRRRSAGGELRWEKGGGGAASVMTLLGLAGRSAEAEELLLSLETEGVEALPASLYNAAIAACASDRAWERALNIYNRMLLSDGTGGSGGGSGTGGGGETGAGGWMGVEGVARDMGTYKALVPILELAASSDPGPSTRTDSTVALVSSPSDAERARTALDTVRRTGRVEGLLF